VNTKHTPGPWVVQEWADGTRAIEHGTGDDIVPRCAMKAADAALVAAAPAIYEALAGMLRRYPEQPGTYTPEGAAARAAILRAKGEA